MDNHANTTVGLLVFAILAGALGASFGANLGASFGLAIVSFYAFGFLGFIALIIKEYFSNEVEIEPLEHDITPEGFVNATASQ